MKLCNNKSCILLIRSKRGVSVFIYSGFIRKWINLLSRSVCVCRALLFYIQSRQNFQYCVLMVCEISLLIQTHPIMFLSERE